jgi:hypothetical protein
MHDLDESEVHNANWILANTDHQSKTTRGIAAILRNTHTWQQWCETQIDHKGRWKRTCSTSLLAHKCYHLQKTILEQQWRLCVQVACWYGIQVRIPGLKIQVSMPGIQVSMPGPAHWIYIYSHKLACRSNHAEHTEHMYLPWVTDNCYWNKQKSSNLSKQRVDEHVPKRTNVFCSMCAVKMFVYIPTKLTHPSSHDWTISCWAGIRASGRD